MLRTSGLRRGLRREGGLALLAGLAITNVLACFPGAAAHAQVPTEPTRFMVIRLDVGGVGAAAARPHAVAWPGGDVYVSAAESDPVMALLRPASTSISIDLGVLPRELDPTCPGAFFMIATVASALDQARAGRSRMDHCGSSAGHLPTHGGGPRLSAQRSEAAPFEYAGNAGRAAARCQIGPAVGVLQARAITMVRQRMLSSMDYPGGGTNRISSTDYGHDVADGRNSGLARSGPEARVLERARVQVAAPDRQLPRALAPTVLRGIAPWWSEERQACEVRAGGAAANLATQPDHPTFARHRTLLGTDASGQQVGVTVGGAKAAALRIVGGTSRDLAMGMPPLGDDGRVPVPRLAVTTARVLLRGRTATMSISECTPIAAVPRMAEHMLADARSPRTTPVVVPLDGPETCGGGNAPRPAVETLARVLGTSGGRP